MKNIKKNIFAMFVFALCLFSLTNVKAFDNTITIGDEGSSVTLDYGLNVVTGVPLSDTVYPWFHVKNSNKGDIICLSGVTVDAPGSGTQCNLISSDNYGVAYIIDLISKTSASDVEKYYWTEILVNGYLGTLEQLNSPQSYFYQNVIDDNNKKILSTKLSFSEIIKKAKNHNDGVVSNPTITVNGGKSIQLEFNETVDADGYYYSKPVQITSNVNFNLGNLSNSKFTYSKDGNSYIFKIKQSDVKPGVTEFFSDKLEVSNKYMTASRYNCGSGVQNVGLNYVEEIEKKDSITINGSVTRQKTTIAIKKLDENNMYLSGATLMFQTEAQKDTKEGLKIVTEGKYTPIRNLDPGTYYVSEIEAPKGYNKLEGYIEIKIDQDGKVYFDGEFIENPVLILVNTKTKTKFSKISIVDNKELPGATLTILDENKEVIVDENGNALYEWVSGKEPHYIYGLPVGKYYLKEVKSPDGYTLSEEIVAFEVKGDGSVTEVTMENALEVPVPDTLSSKSVLLIFIGMFDIALGIGILLYVKKNKVTE